MALQSALNVKCAKWSCLTIAHDHDIQNCAYSLWFMPNARSQIGRGERLLGFGAAPGRPAQAPLRWARAGAAAQDAVGPRAQLAVSAGHAAAQRLAACLGSGGHVQMLVAGQKTP